MIIVDKNGVRVEPITGRMSFALEKMGETLPKMLEMVIQKMADRRQEG